MYVEPTDAPKRKAVTVPRLRAMKGRGEKIVALTCYDASFAAQMEAIGVDVALVGDSLGMVVQGHASTLPVTLDQMVYHASLVARGCRRRCRSWTSRSCSLAIRRRRSRRRRA